MAFDCSSVVNSSAPFLASLKSASVSLSCWYRSDQCLYLFDSNVRGRVNVVTDPQSQRAMCRHVKQHADDSPPTSLAATTSTRLAITAISTLPSASTWPSSLFLHWRRSTANLLLAGYVEGFLLVMQAT